jgi:hypothetical protein
MELLQGSLAVVGLLAGLSVLVAVAGSLERWLTRQELADAELDRRPGPNPRPAEVEPTLTARPPDAEPESPGLPRAA